MLTFIAMLIVMIVLAVLILIACLAGVAIWVFLKAGVVIGLLCVIIVAAKELMKHLTKKQIPKQEAVIDVMASPLFRKTKGVIVMKTELIHLAKKASAIVNKNSPTILAALAIAGVGGVIVATVKATPKALKLLEEKDKKMEELKAEYESSSEEEMTDEAYAKQKRTVIIDTGLQLAKVYAPVVIIAGVTIVSIVCANKINLKRLATVTSLYSVSEKTLKEYKQKTLETVGKTKEAEIEGKVHDDLLSQNPLDRSNVIVTGSGETLCYDIMSGRYFKSDIEHIRKRMNDFNYALNHDYALSLNDFYEMLGLDTIGLAEDIGWNTAEPMEIRFDSRLASNGSPCLVLDYSAKPIWNYRDF